MITTNDDFLLTDSEVREFLGGRYDRVCAKGSCCPVRHEGRKMYFKSLLERGLRRDRERHSASLLDSIGPSQALQAWEVREGEKLDHSELLVGQFEKLAGVVQRMVGEGTLEELTIFQRQKIMSAIQAIQDSVEARGESCAKKALPPIVAERLSCVVRKFKARTGVDLLAR